MKSFEFDPTGLEAGTTVFQWSGKPDSSDGLLVFELLEDVRPEIDTVQARLKDTKAVLAHSGQFSPDTDGTTRLEVSRIQGARSRD
jgi:hypothetical protein